MSRILLVLLCAVTAVQPDSYGYLRLIRSERALQQIGDDGNLRTVCSGSTIGDGYHVLTAAHCTTEDVFISGERARLVYRDEDLDLAVLSVTSYARPLKVQSDAPTIGQRIAIVGHPVGLSPQYFRGYISSLDTVIEGRTFQMFDATSCGGNSGSAVTNDHDEIVSVLQIGWGRPCSGFTGGALWRDVARVIGRYGKAA